MQTSSIRTIAIYPREGTETQVGTTIVFVSIIAIYPREGTETILLCGLCAHGCKLLQFIPARGRKRFSHLRPLLSMTLQFIPARGRKQHCFTFFLFVGIAIYPREGTETNWTMQRLWSLHCNLSPRGDGNRRFRQLLAYRRRLQFIPARGRKRKAVFINVIPCPLQFIPARGRKPSAFGDGAGHGDCNLSPQGDGNILLLTWKENRSIIDLSL